MQAPGCTAVTWLRSSREAQRHAVFTLGTSSLMLMAAEPGWSQFPTQPGEERLGTVVEWGAHPEGAERACGSGPHAPCAAEGGVERLAVVPAGPGPRGSGWEE